MKNRINSFSFAIKGIAAMFKEEPNAKIHAVAALLIIVLGWYLQLSLNEWINIVLAIGLVFGAEAFNTAIESLGNAITQEKNHHIKNAKDIAAGGVLISACTAATIGLLVFVPKIWDKLLL